MIREDGSRLVIRARQGEEGRVRREVTPGAPSYIHIAPTLLPARLFFLSFFSPPTRQMRLRSCPLYLSQIFINIRIDIAAVEAAHSPSISFPLGCSRLPIREIADEVAAAYRAYVRALSS